MALWRGAEHGSVMFHVPAGHFHNAGGSTVDRSHPTPDAASAMGGGFDVVFQRSEQGVRAARIRVFPTETVASLQKKIFAATNIPPVQQHLALGGMRLSTGSLRDYGLKPGDTIEQAPLPARRPTGVPLTPQVPSARPSTKPRTPSPTTPRDGMSRVTLVREMNSPRGARSDTLRYDPSWQMRAASARSAGGTAPTSTQFPKTPGGTLSGRSTRPPTATELALASRRGTQSKPMPWAAQYKASSSQGFGIVNPNSTLTPRHYGDFPPTRREPHVPMPGGRGGVAQVEQISHRPSTAASQTNTEDHVAAALQTGVSATHTSAGRRLPTAGGDPRLGDVSPAPFTPKSLSAQQEYYAVKWGALSRGVTPKPLVTGDPNNRWH